MPKIISISLLLLLVGVSAHGQTPVVQPTTIIISFVPAPTSASTHYPAGIVGSISSPQRLTDNCEVFLLSNNDGHVVARTFADRNGQFRFLNLVPEIFDVVFRIEGFESASVTRVTAGATVTVPVTLARKLDTAGDSIDLSAYVVDIGDLKRAYPKKSLEEFQKAVNAEHLGETAKSIGLLEELVQVTPEFYEAHSMLGSIYQRQGQFRDAEQQYNIFRDLRPKSALPLLNLATLYLQEAEANEKEGRFVIGVMYDDALHMLQDAARLEPRNARVFFLLGVLFYRANSDTLAEGSLNQALFFEPYLGSARLALANLYIRQRKWNEARSQLDKYLADNPSAADRSQVEGILARLNPQQ
jgi:tetratricopeptide (TPR) repeat protein